MKNQIKIPLWINLFGGFLTLFGLSLAIAGYIKPDIVIPGFIGDTNAHYMAIWMASARNIAMAVVMSYALISKQPSLIGLAFLMRFITEFFDMFGIVNSGVMEIPSVAIYLIFLFLFIIPEALAFIKMIRLNKNSYAQDKNRFLEISSKS